MAPGRDACKEVCSVGSGERVGAGSSSSEPTVGVLIHRVHQLLRQTTGQTDQGEGGKDEIPAADAAPYHPGESQVAVGCRAAGLTWGSNRQSRASWCGGCGRWSGPLEASGERTAGGRGDPCRDRGRGHRDIFLEHRSQRLQLLWLLLEHKGLDPLCMTCPLVPLCRGGHWRSGGLGRPLDRVTELARLKHPVPLNLSVVGRVSPS